MRIRSIALPRCKKCPSSKFQTMATIETERQKSCTTKTILIFKIWKYTNSLQVMWNETMPMSASKKAGIKAIGEACQEKWGTWGQNRKCKRILKTFNAALTPRRIWLRMGLRMQFATNSQWSQGVRQTFVGVRKHSRSFTGCYEY